MTITPRCRYAKLSAEEVRLDRYAKFRKLGQYEEFLVQGGQWRDAREQRAQVRHQPDQLLSPVRDTTMLCPASPYAPDLICPKVAPDLGWDARYVCLLQPACTGAKARGQPEVLHMQVPCGDWRTSHELRPAMPLKAMLCVAG